MNTFTLRRYSVIVLVLVPSSSVARYRSKAPENVSTFHAGGSGTGIGLGSDGIGGLIVGSGGKCCSVLLIMRPSGSGSRIVQSPAAILALRNSMPILR